MKRRAVAVIGVAMVLALVAGTQVGAAGSSGGTQAWESTYAEGIPSAGFDVLTSPDGRTVFVTGRKQRDRLFSSMITIAYDAVSGERRWSRGWGAVSDAETVEGTALTMSPDGSILYAAGTTWCRDECPSAQDDTYVAIAYDAATGQQLWVTRIPNDYRDGRPTEIAVTPDGSRLVVSGDLGFYDLGRILVLDAATGGELWSQNIDFMPVWGRGMALSPDGATAFVVGSGSVDGVDKCVREQSVIVAYDVATGDERFRRAGACVWATAVGVDPSGSRVVMTGGGGPYPPRLGTTAFDPETGEELWSTDVSGVDWSGETSPDMVVAPDGSQVFVTGPERVPSNKIAARTVAMDMTTGEVTWQRLYEGSGFVAVTRMAASDDGSTVFATGQDRQACNHVPCDPRDYSWGLVLAYDTATGDRRWVANYPGGYGSAIASSPDGSRAYLAGSLMPDSTASARLRARGQSCTRTCGVASVSYNNATRAYRTEDSDVGVRWSTWTGRFVDGALGGSDRLTRTRGASASYVSSARDTVKWLTRVGPTMGKARLVVDGVAKGTFDLYAPTYARRVVKIDGLEAKRHDVRLVVAGQKNAASRGSWVVADAFATVFGRDTKQENDRFVSFGSWRSREQPMASGGTVRVSARPTDRASMTFRGGTVRFVTARGPAYGKARVVVDGKARRVDLYSAKRQWQVPIVFTGLGKGTHTITVRPLGIKDARSRGKAVVVDAFVVRP